MKKNYFFKYALLLTVLFSVSLSSCSSDKDDEELPEIIDVVKKVSFPAQSYTEWTYFSFEKGEVIKVDQDKYNEDTTWDMGFLRFNIRTNGGMSGKGKGGALATDMKKFDQVPSMPKGEFVEDTEVEVMASGGMPPKYVTTTGNTAFKVGENQGWAWYDFKNGVWSINNNVFIIRTANGEFAKVIMKSFLDDSDKSGYVTFEYVYPFN